jgi:hypothetical protein
MVGWNKWADWARRSGCVMGLLLVACGGADVGAGSAVEASTGVETEAVTTPTPFTITLPHGLSPGSVAAGATEALILEDRAKIVRVDGSFAAATSVGTVTTTIGVDARTGNLVSKPSVTLRGANTATLFNVNGDATTGGTVTIQNHARVSGTTTAQATITSDDFTRSVVIPAAGQPVTLSPNTSRTLQPGSFAVVHAYQGATLTLNAGTYYFSSLQLEPGSKVVLKDDVSPVNIYLRDTLMYKGVFTETATGSLVGNVLVGALGTADITIETPYLGTLIAPKAKVVVRSNASGPHKGAFYGRRVELSPDAVLEHHTLPSRLIQRVDVSKTSLCQDEPALVTVTATTWSGTALPATSIEIGGVPGNPRYVSFNGHLGTRTLVVSARDGSQVETRVVTFQLVNCATVYPRVVMTASYDAPYVVEFFVQNAAAFPGGSYVWTFGDGTQTTTAGPYVQHSYRDRITATDEILSFATSLKLVQPGKPDITSPKTVALSNSYAVVRKRGFIRPLYTAPTEFRRDGGAFLADVSIKNVETTALTLTERRLEYHFCDAGLEPELKPLEPLSFSIAAGATGTTQVQLDGEDLPRSVCSVAAHYAGSTAGGLPALVSSYLEVPDRDRRFIPVTDATTLALLAEVDGTGLNAKPNRIADEELWRLLHNGKIGTMPQADDSTPLIHTLADTGSAPALGEECVEGTEPVPGLACVASTNPDSSEEWKIAPPLIRNALKGDVFITAGCGIVGDILRNVEPKQFYTHEAIMTSNYYDLAHSTFNQERIESSVQAPGEHVNGNLLKFGWPGTLNESVLTAFGINTIPDPDNVPRTFRTFHPALSFCDKDESGSPPILLRPPPASEAAIRPLLRAAADIAAGFPSHYRLFGFTEANITFPGVGNFRGTGDFNSPDGLPPTVSTTFIWQALIKAGVVLEGSTVEAPALPPTGKGIIDGLYLYTEEERAKAATTFYEKYQEQIRTRQDKEGTEIGGGLTEAFTNQADEVTAQIVNCFASDACGVSDGAVHCTPQPGGPDQCKLNRDFEHPGIGVAVSPEDFRFWDPATVATDGSVTGAYGDEQPLLYRGGDYRRVFRWVQAADAGTFAAKVVLKADGTPVADAIVTFSAWSAGSDAAGNVVIPGVLAITDEARAEKIIDGVNNVGVTSATVPAGGTISPPIVIEIEPEGLHPPPGLRGFEREVTFSGPMHVVDDDAPDPDEVCDFEMQGHCHVSPIAGKRQQNDVILGATVAASSANDPRCRTTGVLPCTGNEVRSFVKVNCTLRPDNASVRVEAIGELYEDDECRFDDHDGEGASPLVDVPGDGSATVAVDVENDDEGDGDPAHLSHEVDWASVHDLVMTNTQGAEVTLPDALPESRRSVVMKGTLHILDDDIAIEIDEPHTFEIEGECFLDPFSGPTNFGFHDCQGDEVVVKGQVTCTTSAMDPRQVIIGVRMQLLEGSTCLTEDEDGTTPARLSNGTQPPLTFTLDECAEADGCEGRHFVLRVDNTDEGGDYGTMDVKFFNAQAP